MIWVICCLSSGSVVSCVGTRPSPFAAQAGKMTLVSAVSLASRLSCGWRPSSCKSLCAARIRLWLSAQSLKSATVSGRCSNSKLGGTDAVSSIGFEHLQKCAADIQLRGGAGQGCPQFLFKRGNCGRICGSNDQGLVEVPGEDKAPFMGCV